jgi:putative ABC transport system permease protein
VLAVRGEAVSVRTSVGVARAQLTELAYADPMLDGLVVQIEGRAPQRAGEVVLSPRLLERTGLRVGDPLTLTEPEVRGTIVGVARVHGDVQVQEILAAPGLLPKLPTPDLAARLFIDTPQPLTWPEVQELNKRGIAAYSAAVLRDPPPSAAIHDDTDAVFILMVMALVGLLGGLEVVLLAGAAFAVGTRRQARALAVVMASGGGAPHVRAIVLAGGMVLGLVGGVTGVLLGVGAAAAGRRVIENVAAGELGRFDVRPLELFAIAALGVLVGLLAALVPARAASRMDVVAALAGRRGSRRTPKRVPVIGVLVLGAGIAASIVGSGLALALSSGEREYSDALSRNAAIAVAAGAGLTLIGLVIASPAIVGGAGRLGRFLPLTPRLALRDASRNRSRTAPAVAAILAGVTGATAITLYVAATDAKDRRQYQAVLPPSTAAVQLSSYDGGERRIADAEQARAAVERHLAVREVLTLSSPREICEARPCQNFQVVIPAEHQCPEVYQTGENPLAADADWRCRGDGYATRLGFSTVVDAPTLSALGVPVTDEVRRVLAAGGIVTTMRQHVVGGRATLERSTTDGDRTTNRQTTTVPAVLVEPVPTGTLFLSAGAAGWSGLEIGPENLLLQLERLPSEREEDAAVAALQNAGLSEWSLYVERGYVSEFGPGLLALILGSAIITLGAAGVATGLAQADSRPDYATLAAVGATPGLRRVLATCQAGVVAVLGTVLGIAAGFVPAMAFIRADPELELALPWANLAVILLGIPLLAAVAAGLLVRSDLPLGRRVAD